ncbi:IS1380 family transposase, partial [Escherichia coli]|nr:IS1380 family transposase [Escherichia coli]
IRRTLITVPARIASSARRLTLHLPRNWPWETEWNQLFTDTWRRKPQAT